MHVESSQAFLTSASLTFGNIVLVLYDYIITLDREIRFLWTKGLTGFKFLFFANRYAGLLKAVLIHVTLWLVDTTVSVDVSHSDQCVNVNCCSGELFPSCSV